MIVIDEILTAVSTAMDLAKNTMIKKQQKNLLKFIHLYWK